MNDDPLERQIEAARQRLTSLKQRADAFPQEQALLEDILAALNTSLEELHAATEALRQQNEQLTAVRQQVEAERHRYMELFDQAPDGCLVTDPDGVIQEANLAAGALLEIPTNELVGQPVVSFVAQEDRPAFHRHLIRLQQLLRTQNWEVRLQRRNGLTFSAVIDVAGTRDRASKLAGLRWIIRDVTERRSLEARLLQSQKLESIGQLAGGVAHDFNNILTVIQGHASLLEAKQGLPPNLASHANQIVLAAERAANLTRQLLTFSRRQVIHPKNLDLSEVIGNMTKMLQRILGEDISLQVNFTSNLPLIYADAGMLEQVLLNLAVNSRDSMPKGGRLMINVSTVTMDTTYPGEEPEAASGEWVRLRVIDTGCGIPPEHLPHIFEPFFTTKDVGKGTGLGLATVYGIVKQHQGWITVASEAGKGTTFQIFLPSAGKRDALTEATSSEQEVRGGAETILLVEDEPDVRELARSVLEEYGYSVFDAATGTAALKLWQEHKSRIQLLLTDIVMPEGMTGLDLAQRLQAEKAGLKVIYSSGYSTDAITRDLKFSEKANFVQKPYTPRKLARIVRDCLDGEL